mgnify:CR=1 FL=1
MTLPEILLLAAALAMDAFAVSLGLGTAAAGDKIRAMLAAGLYFGLFQGIMPVLGYGLGLPLEHLAAGAGGIAAFLLLSWIGWGMIRESRRKEDSRDKVSDEFSLKPGRMLILAVATSIDALAAGAGLAFTGSGILIPALLIGGVTMIISAAGAGLGSAAGKRLGSQAEAAGGTVLILIGIRALLTAL